MLIGLISDTHDNLPFIEKAVNFLNQKEVELVLHAGDFIAPFSLKPLGKLRCPWWGVFGNNDGEKEGLRKNSEGRIQAAPLEIFREGRKVVLMHEFQDREGDILVFGHTHYPEIRREKGKLLVNPGEVCGYLSGRPTLAVVDISSLQAEIITLS